MEEMLRPEGELPVQTSLQDKAILISTYLGDLGPQAVFSRPDIPLDEQDINPEQLTKIAEGELNPLPSIAERIEATSECIYSLLSVRHDPYRWFTSPNSTLGKDPEWKGLTPVQVMARDPKSVVLASHIRRDELFTAQTDFDLWALNE